MKSRAITEADILAQVILPDGSALPPGFARTILELRFGSAAVERMNALAEKNRLGTSTEAESGELEKYLRVGNFLNLLQAKVRQSLKGTD